MIFNENLVLPFGGFDENTKKKIEARAKQEKLLDPSVVSSNMTSENAQLKDEYQNEDEENEIDPINHPHA